MNPWIKDTASNNIEMLTQPGKDEELPPTGEQSDYLEKTNNYTVEQPDVSFIECTSRAALLEQNASISTEDQPTNDISENKGLTDEERNKIKGETGWLDEIIDNIKNMKQYEILKNAGLIEVEINARICLIKENIDLDYTDADGVSNRERLGRGLAPLDSKTGEQIELHHLGQKTDSPLVELTKEEHRTGKYEEGKKNQSLWHNNSLDTEVHGGGNTWAQERKTHWKARSAQNPGVNN